MKLVVDMCLPPALVGSLVQYGYDAIHWSDVGEPTADDTEIMKWARTNAYIVITHDLDFGDLLFMSLDPGPSVIILREKNITPSYILDPLLRILRSLRNELAKGALISMTNTMARVRSLPLR